MSKADKMFLEIGYRTEDGFTFNHERMRSEITFEDRGVYIYRGEPWLHEELLKAVIQKLKELGWYNNGW